MEVPGAVAQPVTAPATNRIAIRNIRNDMWSSPRDRSVRDAAELGEDVRVVGLEPVAEARAHQGVGGRPRAALQHVVFAVEEVGGIALVAWDVGGEAGQAREHAARPLPAVADQILHAPGARALGMRTHRRRRPVAEADIAVLGSAALRGPGDRGVEPGLAVQTPAPPAPEGPRPGEAHVDRPVPPPLPGGP